MKFSMLTADLLRQSRAHRTPQDRFVQCLMNLPNQDFIGGDEC